MSRREEDPPVDDTESEEDSSEEDSDDEDTPEELATPLVTNQTLPDVTSRLDNLHLDIGNNQRRRNPTPAPTYTQSCFFGLRRIPADYPDRRMLHT
jgi:hypothetical protein